VTNSDQQRRRDRRATEAKPDEALFGAVPAVTPRDDMLAGHSEPVKAQQSDPVVLHDLLTQLIAEVSGVREQLTRIADTLQGTPRDS
jgi:hypothetical protein